MVLRILDAAGKPVRRYSSTDAAENLPAEQYFSDRYRRPAGALPSSAGAHRWVWNLRYPRPAAATYEYSIAAVDGEETPLLPEGPLALPGQYAVELVVDGQRLSAPLSVQLDPRLQLKDAELRAIFDFNLDVAAVLAPLVAQVQTATARREQLTGAAASDAERSELAALVAQLDGTTAQRGLNSWAEILAGLASDAESAERVPTAAQVALLARARAALAP